MLILACSNGEHQTGAAKEKQWRSNGEAKEKQWRSKGEAMEKQRRSNGEAKEKQWRSKGEAKEKQRRSKGEAMEKQRVNAKRVGKNYTRDGPIWKFGTQEVCDPMEIQKIKNPYRGANAHRIEMFGIGDTSGGYDNRLDFLPASTSTEIKVELAFGRSKQGKGNKATTCGRVCLCEVGRTRRLSLRSSSHRGIALA
ncbi:putative dynactin p25 [Plasmodium ovale curtisi]|uniref:Putative dynactin p25 n=1 Tax=Plasmodium ovale curtisi TaxID=864141 RepID=A0A1A8VPB0_PLAOA|nr:putative dynactin p25 [Plasmodium ovale curtisi]